MTIQGHALVPGADWLERQGPGSTQNDLARKRATHGRAKRHYAPPIKER